MTGRVRVSIVFTCEQQIVAATLYIMITKRSAKYSGAAGTTRFIEPIEEP